VDRDHPDPHPDVRGTGVAGLIGEGATGGLAAVVTDAAAALRARSRASWRLADAFAESGVHLRGRFADSGIARWTMRAEEGFNIRAAGERGSWQFASTDPADLPTMALELHRASGDPAATGERSERVEAPPSPRRTGDGLPAEDLVADLLPVLARVDEAARRHDGRIRQVVIDFVASRRAIAWADIAATPLVDERELVYLTVRVVAGEGDRVAAGYYAPGASKLRALDGEAARIGADAARRAVGTLSARPAPVGHLPVVVGPGRGAVLLHEACCHPLEADEVLRGTVHSSRTGEAIAAPGVTIVDDPTLPDAAGTYTVDDEGVVAGPTIVVEDGVLRRFLTDRLSALRLGAEPTPNGRRGTFADHPQSRMSNTCLRPGPDSRADIVASTGRGIFAEHVGGGEVVEATGAFVFRVTNGYLIEDGRITDPIAETTIAGQGDRVLAGIDAVGDDVAVGAATCGKFGQWVPVGVVGPTFRVRSLLVGGTER
jgi:TldD protein